MVQNGYKKSKRILKRFISEIKYGYGLQNGNLVTTFWFDKVVNFGDLLTPALLRNYRLLPLHSDQNNADIVSIGSLLEIIPEDFPGFIVGTGLIRDNIRNFPRAKILAVRGERTRDNIGAPASTILGDPGLLADRLLKNKQKKQYTIGILPHYVDKADAKIQKIYAKYPNEVVIIDVQASPLKVLTEIDQCRFILSSSLHGLVAADSLGIPNAWIKLSEKIFGNGFKFYDYESAFGEKYDPSYLTGAENMADLQNITHAVPDCVPEVKRNLDTVFIQLRKEMLGINQTRSVKPKFNY